MDRRRLLAVLGGGAAVVPTYAVAFTASPATTLMIGHETSLHMIQDNAFTAEGWFKITASAAGLTKVLIDKVGITAGTLGWGFGYQTAFVKAQVPCVTTNAVSSSAQVPHDSTWHHWAMTWDDAGDRLVRIFKDGLEVSYGSGGTQTAGVGAIKDEFALNGGIGTAYDGASNFVGSIGWVRISDNVRYTGTFAPTPRNTPPASDANTIRLFNMDDGTGTNVSDYSNNNQDGVLTNGSWVVDP